MGRKSLVVKETPKVEEFVKTIETSHRMKMQDRCMLLAFACYVGLPVLNGLAKLSIPSEVLLAAIAGCTTVIGVAINGTYKSKNE